jgi:hypothetical protein
MRSIHHRVEVLETQMQMIRDDGASPAGELPSPEFLDALEATEPGERNRLEEVRERHRDGRGPPEWASAGGNGGGPS